MRRLALFLATLAILGSASLAHASQPLKATAQQMSELAGSYQLSDGRRLQVDFDGVDVWVRIGKQERRLLDSTAEGRFATVDGKLVLRYTIDAGASKLAVTLPDQSGALRSGPLLAQR